MVKNIIKALHSCFYLLFILTYGFLLLTLKIGPCTQMMDTGVFSQTSDMVIHTQLTLPGEKFDLSVSKNKRKYCQYNCVKDADDGQVVGPLDVAFARDV